MWQHRPVRRLRKLHRLPLTERNVSIKQRLRKLTRNLGDRAVIRALRRRGVVTMLHTRRCGSTVLGRLLDQHPQLVWAGEIYDVQFSQYEKKYGGIEEIRELPPLDLLHSKVRELRSGYYGFDITFRHVEELHVKLGDYIDLLARQGKCQHFVVLERKNLLRAIVSGAISHMTKVYHIPIDDEARQNRVTLDPHNVSTSRRDDWVLSLHDTIDYFQKKYEEVRRDLEGRNALYLTYEDDILEDPCRAYRKCCDFIGLQPAEAEVQLRRVNPHPLSEILENYEEVAAAIRGTKFEWMLDDER